MKVSELIAILQGYPQDATVFCWQEGDTDALDVADVQENTHSYGEETFVTINTVNLAHLQH